MTTVADLEALIAAHPLVKAARVSPDRAVAQIVPRAPHEVDVEVARRLRGEAVAQWLAVWELAYRRPAEAGDFNTAGWISSYTGKPYDAPAMRAWRADTVDAIRALSPRRVLEIGCGMGLLALEIAPHVESYHGTDISPKALAHVASEARARGHAHLTLEERPADRFDGLPAHAYDLVIMNSVSQCFPGSEYLKTVVEGILERLEPGGALFLGDARSLRLLEAFHLSVALARAGAVDAGELRVRCERAAAREEELVIDPAWFAAFAAADPRVAGVRVELQRGRTDTEMARFRYNVVLTVGTRFAGGVTCEAFADGWGTREIEARVEQAGGVLCVTRVPDARVIADVLSLERLARVAATEPASAVRAAAPAHALHPEDLRDLGVRRGWSVEVAPAEPGYLDVVFGGGAGRAPGRSPLVSSAPGGPLSRFTSEPLAAKLKRQTLAILRAHLRERVAQDALPASFELVDALR